MSLSESAKLYLSLCWRDGEIRSIHPIFGEKYLFGEKSIKFTEEIYDEMEKSGRVKVTRSEKSANITGKEGVRS